jgi:hypothetical protein
MPAFLPQGGIETAPQTFDTSKDTLQELLKLFGLESLTDRVNAAPNQ